MNLWCSIASLCSEINRHDICIKLLVLLRSGRWFPVNNFVVSAAVNMKYPTHKLDRIDVLKFYYEGNDFSYCFFANMAVAFFNISFSISSSRIFF